MIKKVIITVIVIAVIVLSFMGGQYYEKKENIKVKNNKCNTYISFAISSLEHMKTYEGDETYLKAIISDIYAAKEITTDMELNSALHELWNALMFDGYNLENREDELIDALKNYRDNPGKIKDIAMSMRIKR